MVSDPTKEVSGEFKGQEDSERLPWKLPVIIGVPVVTVLSKPRFPAVHHLWGKIYIFNDLHIIKMHKMQKLIALIGGSKF